MEARGFEATLQGMLRRHDRAQLKSALEILLLPADLPLQDGRTAPQDDSFLAVQSRSAALTILRLPAEFHPQEASAQHARLRAHLQSIEATAAAAAAAPRSRREFPSLEARRAAADAAAVAAANGAAAAAARVLITNALDCLLPGAKALMRESDQLARASRFATAIGRGMRGHRAP